MPTRGDRHLRAIQLAKQLAELGARLKTIHVVTGIPPRQMQRLFFPDAQTIPRGRAPDSVEWYHSANLILRSDAFFDAEHHPQARFVGTGFRYEGDKLAALDGELTLLGRTHPVTLRSTSFNCYHSAHLNQDVCGGDFEATILRSQWGMTWGLEIGIPDSVKLLIEIEAIKQA